MQDLLYARLPHCSLSGRPGVAHVLERGNRPAVGGYASLHYQRCSRYIIRDEH
jgi:hypothetical protein